MLRKNFLTEFFGLKWKLSQDVDFFSRKIFNELSSPVSVTKIDEESNSSQSQDGDSQDFKDASAIQYSTAAGTPHDI